MVQQHMTHLFLLVMTKLWNAWFVVLKQVNKPLMVAAYETSIVQGGGV